MEKLILSGCILLNGNNEIILLHRIKHDHYETPGGKIDPEECIDFKNPTIEELKKAALRELSEEISNTIEIEKPIYLDKIEFTIPDGRESIAHKFLVKIKYGIPKVNSNETDIFDHCKSIPINELVNYKLSPDLKLFLPELKNILKTLLKEEL